MFGEVVRVIRRNVRQLLRVTGRLKKFARPVLRRWRRLRDRSWVWFIPAIAKRLVNRQVTYIGVTGSCGKTSTAKLIAAVLSEDGQCILNMENSDLPHLSRSLRSVGPSTKFSVNEVCGASPGKVRRQTTILRPDIGVITTVGSDHYKHYRTLEIAAQEKGMLAEAVPRHGSVILNADDPHVRAMASRCRARVITFGLSPDADVRGTELSGAWPDRLALTVSHGNQSIRVTSQMLGKHWATSILAAVACGIVCGLDLKTCADAISRSQPVLGRYSSHQTSWGAIYILDYKASYWTFSAGLDFLAQSRAPRKTIVIGTLSDYPGAASARYRRVARAALQVADRVLFVGPHSGHVSRLRRGETQDRLSDFQTVYEVTKYLKREPISGELVLIKGSRTDHLERIVLAEIDVVVCWRERCGIRLACPECRNYRNTKTPLGLTETSLVSRSATL